ncbi:hypothetical protein [Streptomyces sp. KL116D]
MPNTSGVRFHDMVTVSLGGTGTISRHQQHGRPSTHSSVAYLTTYP